jgi:hypothetical protein
LAAALLMKMSVFPVVQLPPIVGATETAVTLVPFVPAGPVTPHVIAEVPLGQLPGFCSTRACEPFTAALV